MAGKRRGRHPRNDLDARKVAALTRKGTAGRHIDGQGLHLFIKPGGAASWVLRVTLPGQRTSKGKPVRRDYGLGSVDTTSLAQARERARVWRSITKAGGDPTTERRKARTVPTFAEIAKAVHTDHRASWKNPKHAAQWLSTLEAYAFPMLGAKRVDQIGVSEVLKVLQPIWLTKPETARRLRQRIRTVLDVARAGGYRETENPVGPVLARALPKQTAKPEHHAAMPYRDLPAFYSRLGDDDGGGETSRLALKLLVLTATRTSEVINARRSEIDLEARVWTIPAARMKAEREHRIPLSDETAAAIRRALELSTDEDLLFPGAKRGKPLSNMALLMLLRRLGVHVTAHGFRSSFSDWCAETTSFPAEVREMALAHAIGDKTEAAYRRGDLFEKRRKLMAAWAAFVTGNVGKVVSLRKAG